MWKKITAALLTACMLFSMPSSVSFAGSVTEGIEAVEETETEVVEETETEAVEETETEVVEETETDAVEETETEVVEETEAEVVEETETEAVEETETEAVEETETEVVEETETEAVEETETEVVEKTETEAVEETETEAVEEPASEPAEEQENSDEEIVKDADMSAASNDFDVEAVYNQILESESVEEIEARLTELSESQQKALLGVIREDDIRQLAEHLDIDLGEDVVTPAKNYTEVGALMPAVNTAPAKSRMRLLQSRQVDDNGLMLSKKAEYDDATDSVKIVLEAYTTGSVTSSSEAVPTDAVLVLDESGSMSDKMYQYSKTYDLDESNNYYVKRGDSYVRVKYCKGSFSHDPGWYTGICLWILHIGELYVPMTSADDTSAEHVQFYTRSEDEITKNQALETAAKTFVNNVYSEAEKNNIDHRVSVIGFASDSTTKIGLSDDIRNNKDKVLAAIDGLNTNGGTYVEKGLKNAKEVFDNANATDVTTRKRVVVVFTDGIPGSGTWNNTTINDSANPAINHSFELKNTYGATVYTIGMLDDADPELDISDDTSDSARTNKFLHYLSSNYPTAKSMDDGGTNGGNNGYYLSASDTASLEAIFQKISEEIAVPTISLGSDTIIKDIVSPYFDIPEGTADISVKTFNCLSYNGETQEATWENEGVVLNNAVTITENTLSVTGFDFNKNFVSEKLKPETNDHGKKVVIELEVTPKSGFLGGNGVLTNGAESGVYKGDGTEVERFEQPKVDVPIKNVTVDVPDKHVYLLTDITTEELKNGATIEAEGSIVIDPGLDNYGLESWQNAYVNINISTTPEAGFSDLTDDQEYTVSAEIQPIASGSVDSTQGSATGNIFVYKPILTFKDSTVHYGDKAPVKTEYYNKNNMAGESVWKHEDIVADTDMMGLPPTLVCDYVLPGTAYEGDIVNTKEDIPVNVSVKIEDVDITEYTTFAHKDCDPHCNFDSEKEEFLLHVKTCSLTVTKKGGDTGEKFIFDITKDGQKYTSIVVDANSSITIGELPVGSYGVTEDMDWSWRYTGLQDKNSVTLSADDPTETITYTNKKENDQWLSYKDVVKNVYGISAQSPEKGGNE